MNRITALLIVTVLWAAIFLPGLDSVELKGEEGRRIMPAVTMLEGGSWIVPEVGGKPFLRKPPLVQWCIASSLKLFGHSVWAARLPSVLSVLALAVVMILCTRGWLITEQSLIAAIVMMVQVATVEKCRLAELEAIYVALSGIAVVLWMSWWSQRLSPWLVWTVPMVFNALAFLAKAPLHLLFFYAVILPAMFAAGAWRRPWTQEHSRSMAAFFVGWLVFIGIVASWALPYWQQVDQAELARTVNRQAVERFTGAESSLGTWAANLPSGLANHLPWVLFAPLLWRRTALEGQHARTVALLAGGRWGVAICFVGLLLIPGVLPRYVQPLVTPFSLLLAPVLWDCPRAIRHGWRYAAFGFTALVFLAAAASPFLVAAATQRGAEAIHPAVACLVILPAFTGALLLMALRRRLHETLHLTLWTGLIAAMAMLLFATVAVPWMRLKDDIRPFAERVDAVMPPGNRLIAYGLDDFAPLLAALFYMNTPYTYAADATAVPPGRQMFLIRGKDRAKFERRFSIEGEPLVEWAAKDDKLPTVVVWATRRERDSTTSPELGK